MSIQKTGNQLYDSKWSRFLLLAWLITLPFGAWLLPVPMGGFTLYANLALTLLLCLPALLTFRRWTAFNWIYLAFCSLWFAVALGMALQDGIHTFSKFDLRSLFMQLGFFLVLTNAYFLFPADKLLRYLGQGFHFYFAILLAFGLFESLTGIHVQGFFTDKLLLRSGEINMAFTPVFIYDNPNDYLCYCLFFYMAVTTLHASFYHKRHGLKIGLLLVIYFFAFLGQGNLAKILVISLLACELFYVLRDALRDVKFRDLYIYAIGGLLLVVVLFRLNFYPGPEFGDSRLYQLNDVKVIEKDDGGYKLLDAKKVFTAKELQNVSNDLDRKARENPNSSKNIRTNLILNGLAFIKEKPLLGIGPGNYQKRHFEHRVPHYAYTLTSAHNFPIEIISQFGIFGWVYLGFVLWFFIRFVKRFWKDRTSLNFSYLLFFFALPFLWMMPSSYLYLDVHWLLVPLLFLLYATQKAAADVD
ncbi:MAG: O-antigen ligase family protein [Bacteroidota bacterium]